jgi:hypothetical protein
VRGPIRHLAEPPWRAAARSPTPCGSRASSRSARRAGHRSRACGRARRARATSAPQLLQLRDPGRSRRARGAARSGPDPAQLARAAGADESRRGCGEPADQLWLPDGRRGPGSTRRRRARAAPYSSSVAAIDALSRSPTTATRVTCVGDLAYGGSRTAASAAWPHAVLRRLRVAPRRSPSAPARSPLGLLQPGLRPRTAAAASAARPPPSPGRPAASASAPTRRAVRRGRGPRLERCGRSARASSSRPRARPRRPAASRRSGRPRRTRRFRARRAGPRPPG